MGAYQPIEMSGRSPMLEAMDKVGESLSSLGDQRDRQARAKKEEERFDQQAYQRALSEAQELGAAGQYEAAAAKMAPFKGRYHKEAPAGPPAPVSPQGLPPGTPPGAGKIPPAPKMAPQGGSPLPDMAEFDMDHGQTPEQLGQEQGPIDPNFVDSLPFPTVANQLMDAAQPRPSTAAGDLHAATEQQQQVNQAKARNLLAFTPPGGGPEQTIDMDAGGERMRERRLAHLDAAMAGSQDPLVQKWYPQLRAAVATGDEDIKPMDALRYIHYMEATEQSGANAKTKEELARDAMAQRGDLTGQRIAAGHENAHIAGKARTDAASILANRDLKEGGAATTVATRLDTEWDRFLKQQDAKKVLGGTRLLESADHNINSGNPLAEHDAQVALGRFFRNGMPTEGEMHLLYQNLAGRLGNALPRFIESMERGGLTPAEVDIVKGAISAARVEQGRIVSNVIRGARHEFGPGSGHDNLAGNINAKFRGALAGFGLSDDEIKAAGDLYPPGAADAPVPMIEYGKGNPQVDKTPKRKPATGAKPAVKSTADYLKMLGEP